jgi:hypothetical protein
MVERSKGVYGHKAKKKSVLADKHLDLKMRRGNNIEMGLRKSVMFGSFFNLWLASVAVSLIDNTVTGCQSWKMVYLYSFFTEFEKTSLHGFLKQNFTLAVIFIYILLKEHTTYKSLEQTCGPTTAI